MKVPAQRRISYIPVDLVPRKRDGTVHHVVRPGTVITVSRVTHEKFASAGQHICGVIDRAGISLAVFAARDCPECNEEGR